MFATFKVTTIPVVIGAIVLLTTACGGGQPPATTNPSPVSPTAAPTTALLPVAPSPAPTVVVAPTTVVPTMVAQTPDAGVGDIEETQLALGERIYKTDAARGVGCQLCHGPDARGDIGPDIRGKQPGAVGLALSTVPDMAFIRLDERQIEAVSAYLQWLGTQP